MAKSMVLSHICIKNCVLGADICVKRELNGMDCVFELYGNAQS